MWCASVFNLLSSGDFSHMNTHKIEKQIPDFSGDGVVAKLRDNRCTKLHATEYM